MEIVFNSKKNDHECAWFCVKKWNFVKFYAYKCRQTLRMAHKYQPFTMSCHQEARIMLKRICKYVNWIIWSVEALIIIESSVQFVIFRHVALGRFRLVLIVSHVHAKSQAFIFIYVDFQYSHRHVKVPSFHTSSPENSLSLEWLRCFDLHLNANNVRPEFGQRSTHTSKCHEKNNLPRFRIRPFPKYLSKRAEKQIFQFKTTTTVNNIIGLSLEWSQREFFPEWQFFWNSNTVKCDFVWVYVFLSITHSKKVPTP